MQKFKINKRNYNHKHKIFFCTTVFKNNIQE